MSREETKIVIGCMIASYPNYKPVDMAMTVDTWTNFMKDYSLKDVMKGLEIYITTDTSGFAPSIGQIINNIHNVNEIGNIMSDMEAWAVVRKAIGNSSYHAQEEFDKLPDLIKRCVGNANNLKAIASSEDYNEDVEKALFIKTYKAEVEREKRIARMPVEVRIAIGQNERMMLNG